MIFSEILAIFQARIITELSGILELLAGGKMRASKSRGV
jgi:hypothetical protein